MPATRGRRAKTIHVWVHNAADRSSVDLATDQIPGWHCRTYPPAAGDPVELCFFDHAAADAAVRQALASPLVSNASPFHCFETGRRYSVVGADGTSGTVKVTRARGRYVEFTASEDDLRPSPNWLAPKGRKQIKVHTATNYLRGEYFTLSRKLHVYAADDAGE